MFHEIVRWVRNKYYILKLYALFFRKFAIIFQYFSLKVATTITKQRKDYLKRYRINGSICVDNQHRILTEYTGIEPYKSCLMKIKCCFIFTSFVLFKLYHIKYTVHTMLLLKKMYIHTLPIDPLIKLYKEKVM